MATKAEYLQRYLSGSSDKTLGSGGDFKVKKRRKGQKEKRIRIIDPDEAVACPVAAPKVTKRHIRAAYESEPESDDDDRPQVEIIKDANVDELAAFGKFKTDNWTSINQNAASSSRGRRRHDSSDSDDSGDDRRPPVRQRHDSSDASPPRRNAVGKQEVDSDASPPRRNTVGKQEADSDASPPRRSTTQKSAHKNVKEEVDSDASPPRRGRPPAAGSSNGNGHIKQEIDSDASPPRRRGNADSDGDLSPPRKSIKQERDASPERRRRRSSPPDSSPPRKREKSSRWGAEEQQPAAKTLEGKRAGLQSADALRREADELRRREQLMFEKLDATVSGRDAAPVARRAHYDKKTGQHIDPAKQQQEKEEAAKKQAELEEKYKKWNKGLRQIEERKSKLNEMAELAAKPFARHAGDEDVEAHLKAQVLKDDPMLQYMQKKKEKKKINRGELIFPKYQGPLPAPNRFGIGPGYRWDGVDRSSGFEAKLSSKKNDTAAENEEFLKWQMGTYE